MDRIPKIVFVLHSLVRGGSPIFLLEFVRGLRGDRIEMAVISEKDGPLREAFEQLGVKVHILPRGGFLELGLLRRMIRCLRSERADLVHLNTFSSYYKYGALAGRILRLPVVWGIREDVRARRCRRLYPWIKSLATCIVPCSHEIAAALYPGGAPPKVEVVHDGIPLETAPAGSAGLRVMLELAPAVPLIGCVAALEPRKGIAELIDAFARLRQQGHKAHLVCVGEDRSAGHAYRPQLEKQIERLGLAGWVHLTGGRADVLGFYKQFDLLVLPTYWEGIARVLLEAVQARCPIVTTQAGGNGELIEDGEGGLLVPPGDVAALATAMARLLTDPELGRSFADHSARILQRDFTLEKQVERMREIYRALLESSKAKACRG